MEAEARFAASAYKSLAQLKDNIDQKSLGKVIDAGSDNFGSMVSEAVSSFTQQVKSADAQTQAMATGKADLVDVVTAVSQTQVAMETLVSVRDQVIGAYEKILAMQI
jgi:flagellar hook-basal body complex protein FliE